MHASLNPVLSPGITIIESFPNPVGVKYDQTLWQKQHTNNMVIINCHAKDVYFPEHWTPLSIKCAFGGREYYHFHNGTIAVDDEKFLILNEGACYSSSIESKTPTESFTLNFTSENIRDVTAGTAPHDIQMDNPFDNVHDLPQFIEKLYPHGDCITNPVMKIRDLIKQKEQQKQVYFELLYVTLENMIRLHEKTEIEIDNFNAVRRSTKEEMYKRLSLAKDYIDSCFSEDISLHRLSRICLLNPHYLLRQFKKMYAITPHQYVTKRRLQEAASLLLHSDVGVSDVARTIGFSDPASFSKLFKRHFGYPPEKFRGRSPITKQRVSKTNSAAVEK